MTATPAIVPGLPAASADAAAARRAAAQILSESRFHSGPVPRPLHGLLAAIGRALRPIEHALSRSFHGVAAQLPGGAPALWTILAVLALLAIVALTRRVSRRVLRDAAAAAPAPSGPPATAAALELEAAQAERDGRLDDAVRLRFQAGLTALAERELIASATSTPTGQVRRTLRSERFDALARRFDEIVYGGAPARPEDVEAARHEWPLLLEARR